ncbi:PHD finger protein [Tanacetum coccineum]
MASKPTFSKLIFWATLSLLFLLHTGHAINGDKCEKNGPSLKQTQTGFNKPPTYTVEVQNTCPTCPVIDIHVKCGNFSQGLVNPRVFRVLGQNDCVVNNGSPLEPL